MNLLWLILILSGVFLGVFSHQEEAIITALFDSCKEALISVALPLAGVMALWLGMMALAEKSGLLQIIARFLYPCLRFIFPEIPKDHPALGSIMMNMTANMLGLGNAATPFGIKAMQQLEKLSPLPGVATNSMVTFLAINTSSLQLLPTTAISILATAHATHPTAIIGATLLTTSLSFIFTLIMSKLLAKIPYYRFPKNSFSCSVANQQDQQEEENSFLKENFFLKSFSWYEKMILILFFLFFLYSFLSLVYQKITHTSFLFALIESLSLLIIPFVISFLPLYAFLRKISIYHEFVEGAKEALTMVQRIFPYLIAIFVGITLFKSSGSLDFLGKLLSPLLSFLHLPEEILPLVLIRPFSGSAAIGIFSQLVHSSGPDSFASYLGGTILGSTETTFYVLALYFGAIQIKKGRHALLCGLLADGFAVLFSSIICHFLFSLK